MIRNFPFFRALSKSKSKLYFHPFEILCCLSNITCRLSSQLRSSRFLICYLIFWNFSNIILHSCLPHNYKVCLLSFCSSLYLEAFYNKNAIFRFLFIDQLTDFSDVDNIFKSYVNKANFLPVSSWLFSAANVCQKIENWNTVPTRRNIGSWRLNHGRHNLNSLVGFKS